MYLIEKSVFINDSNFCQCPVNLHIRCKVGVMPGLIILWFSLCNHPVLTSFYMIEESMKNLMHNDRCNEYFIHFQIMKYKSCIEIHVHMRINCHSLIFLTMCKINNIQSFITKNKCLSIFRPYICQCIFNNLNNLSCSYT